MFDKLAFGTNAFTNGRWTIGGAIRAIAREGYKAVNILADAPLVWPPNDSTYIKWIKKAVRETGVTVAGINGFTAAGHYGKRDKPPGQDFGPSFSDKDAELRALKVKYCKQTIDLAGALECRNISISSGYPPKGADREDAWEWMMEAISEALEYAEKNDVNLNMEFEPALLIANTQDAAKLLQLVPSKNLGVNFDIGHSFCVGEDVLHSIRRLAPYINGADIEDIKLFKGKPLHFHEVPGDGVMPLPEIMKLLQEIGLENRGFYTVELYSQSSRPVEAARRSFAYFKRLETEMRQTP